MMRTPAAELNSSTGRFQEGSAAEAEHVASVFMHVSAFQVSFLSFLAFESFLVKAIQCTLITYNNKA